VTPVKDQGNCSSCWAFSTTGSIESAIAIKTGKLISLSEQELIDCSGNEGNHGCKGGQMDKAFKYVLDAKGICSESAYPYTASAGSCNSQCSSAASIQKYVDLPHENLDALRAAVSLQPVSVAVESNAKGFRFYSGGVYDDPECGVFVDHAVLVVGYGTDSASGKDYWLVKNSRGAAWGDKGYIKLLRTSGKGVGQCGIAWQGSYPIVA
jgi:cathepsin L